MYDGASHGPQRYDVEFPNRAVYVILKNVICKWTDSARCRRARAAVEMTERRMG